MGSPETPGVNPALLSGAEAAAVREQLARMLANPLFTHSKRYPALLRYIVERMLQANPGELKERTIGVELFGREPNYDTNTDPIVRVTAGEVRKRIAQYYHEAGHEREVRIDLSPGSYVPEFIFPEPLTVAPSAAAPLEAATAPAVRRFRVSRWVWPAVAAALVLLAWFKPWTPRTSLDRFWGPVLESSSTVRICVGQRNFLPVDRDAAADAQSLVRRPPATPAPAAPPVPLLQLYYMGNQNVALPDVIVSTRLAGLLQSKGKTFRLLGESTATFEDLRDGPSVLVGAFTNDWTLRLTQSMRFRFLREKDMFRLRDTKSPSRADRVVDYTIPYTALTEDYGLISRVLDQTTERMVVIVGGLTGYSTMAAGELLTNASYMDMLAQHAPAGWNHKNLQIVVATKVINGKSGPPRIVDQYFW